MLLASSSSSGIADGPRPRKRATWPAPEKLEGAARGPYSGGIGWLSVRPGAFDLNIVIRTAVLDPASDSLTIGAGGAVVMQSTPEGESEEMRLKAAALLRAVGEVDGGGGGGKSGEGGKPATVADE